MRIWIVLMAVTAFLVGCERLGSKTLILSPRKAALGESVTGQLTGMSAEGARVFVGGVLATVTSARGNTVEFKVPNAAPTGPQTVLVQSGTEQVRASLGVLGKIRSTEVVVMVNAGVTPAVFQTRLESLGLGLTLLAFRPLNGPGPCAGAIARVGVPAERSVGFVLDSLSQDNLKDVVFAADPQSLWGHDTIHLEAVGVPAAHTRNRKGAGVTIAILDTGVNAHSQLTGRLLPGYDFVNEDNQPNDDFDNPEPNKPSIHGTAVALFAAGSSAGIAPLAQIKPVKVCGKSGECLASEVIRGVCYALANTDRRKLVLNLSFGGDTPVDGLVAVLRYALEQKTLIAAAAGNQGDQGSPTHYPAAHNLPGLVAVGALQLARGGWVPADFSTRGSYVDIAAPGQGIWFDTPSVTFDGTSFSTPLAAGALALWREARPDVSAGSLEQFLKSSAKPIPGAAAPEVGAGLLDLSAAP